MNDTIFGIACVLCYLMGTVAHTEMRRAGCTARYCATAVS